MCTDNWGSPLPTVGSDSCGIRCSMLQDSIHSAICSCGQEGSFPAAGAETSHWLGLVQPALGWEHHLWLLRNCLQHFRGSFFHPEQVPPPTLLPSGMVCNGQRAGIAPHEGCGHQAEKLGSVMCSSTGETTAFPLSYQGKNWQFRSGLAV